MARLVDGQRTWKMTRDDESHRMYEVVWLVEAETTEGPHAVLETPGLPLPGSYWLIDDDVDVWAFCLPGAEVDPLVSNEPNSHWHVKQKFSSKPPPKGSQRCNDNQIEDPLLEPPKISGTFIKAMEEAVVDRFGRAVLNSAHQQVRGPQVEFDVNRPTVRIEFNSAILNLALLSALVDTLNSASLWGLPPRCVKLSNVTWERKYYGTCNIYYTIVLDFDIRYETFDRVLLDEGTKVLNGHWSATGYWELDNVLGVPPDPNDPSHFIRFKDRHDEPTTTILNGHGRPYVPQKFCYPGTLEEAIQEAQENDLYVAGGFTSNNECLAGCLREFTNPYAPIGADELVAVPEPAADRGPGAYWCIYRRITAKSKRWVLIKPPGWTDLMWTEYLATFTMDGSLPLRSDVRWSTAEEGVYNPSAVHFCVDRIAPEYTDFECFFGTLAEAYTRRNELNIIGFPGVRCSEWAEGSYLGGGPFGAAPMQLAVGLMHGPFRTEEQCAVYCLGAVAEMPEAATFTHWCITSGPPGRLTVEKYPSANFLLLPLPTVL